MFDTRKDHGNEVMVALIVFLFLTRAILRVTLTEMDVKTANVTVKKKNLQWNHPPAARSSTWVLNIMTSMLDKSADHEKWWCRFVK